MEALFCWIFTDNQNRLAKLEVCPGTKVGGRSATQIID
uniref:Uncharacterized protein n=1 Tax=Arundo donax TaxID=35708 RepID=A0A0A8ZP93_ARUDO